jgi:hypothetical protein
MLNLTRKPSGILNESQFQGLGISQQRADHRALRRALGRRPSIKAVQNIGLKPATDQVEHAAVADALLEPCDQTLVRDRVEGSGNTLPISAIIRIM